VLFLNKLLDWNEIEIAQVGLVVKDIDYYIKKYWDDYKVGPWNVYTYGGTPHVETFVRERPTNYSMKLAIAYVGNMQIELIQPLEGESIYAEFIKERGDGLHHIRLGNVKNVTEFIQSLTDNGVNILQRGNFQGRKYTYMDTEEDLGVIIEFLEATGPYPQPDYSYPLKNADVEKAETIQNGTAFEWNEISGIGLIVKDIDEYIKTYLTKYQLGPWEVQTYGDHNEIFEKEPCTNYAMKVAFMNIGKTKVNLIQPLNENSIYSEFIKSRGEGFHYIQLGDVKDIDLALKILKQNNVNILQQGQFNESKYMYLDTTKHLAGIIELVKHPLRFPPKGDYVYQNHHKE
jgi:methylmalonyl-CoA/ethylmalonyl-CoA epimerase